MVSILMSLALGDMAMSFHKVMRRRRAVRWDGRVILAAALVILTIVRMWFEVWFIRGVGGVLDFPFYLTLFVEFLVLFLLAAAALPDETAEELSMDGFYEENRRYFWLLFALFQAMFIGHWIWFSGGRYELVESVAVVGPALLYLALAFLRWKLLDYAVPVGLIAYYLVSYWGDRLG
jgi:hypothetical protein